MSAIVAKLGLDSKGFRDGLRAAGTSVGGFSKKATDDMRRATAASSTLGSSFTQIGRQWLSGAVGAFTGAMAFSSLYQGIKAAKEMKLALNDALTYTSGNFTAVDEMKRRLEATTQAIKQGSEYLNSTYNQAILDITGRFKTLGNVIANPLDAWGGKIKPTDDRAEMEKQVQALKKQQLDLQIKIADQEKAALVNKRIGIEQSESYAERLEAERKLKEKIGAANSQPPEVREKLRENARSEYDMEIALIEKKERIRQEDLELQMRIADLQGTAAQKNIRALELEIGLLKKRLDTKRGMNLEERQATGLQVKQKEKQLTDSRVDEFLKSPQQRAAEAEQARVRRAAGRAIASRDRDRADRQGRNGTRENRDKEWDAAFNGGPREAEEDRKGAGDIAADQRRAARVAEFDHAFGRGKKVVEGVKKPEGQAASGDPVVKALGEVKEVLTRIEKKEIGNL